MRAEIILYPKFRQKTILADALESDAIDTLRGFLDERKNRKALTSSYLVKSGINFVLYIGTTLTDDPRQSVMEFYKPDRFRKPDHNEADVGTEDIISEELLISRTISLAMYDSFFIRKSERAVIYVPESDELLANALRSSGFIQDGYIKRHLLIGNNYCTAIVFSMTIDEFYRATTGIVKFNDNFLVIRSTKNAVFSLDVLRAEVLKDIVRLPEYMRFLPENIYEILINDKIYISESACTGLSKAINEVCEYLSGTRTKFDLEPETIAATDFQRSVWKAATDIPYAQTVSYDHIASVVTTSKDKHHPGILSRAVGSALAKNPVMILIPCHRVIGKDGKLRGFAGGLDIKDQLLNHELTNYLKSRR